MKRISCSGISSIVTVASPHLPRNTQKSQSTMGGAMFVPREGVATYGGPQAIPGIFTLKSEARMELRHRLSERVSPDWLSVIPRGLPSRHRRESLPARLRVQLDH